MSKSELMNPTLKSRLVLILLPLLYVAFMFAFFHQVGFFYTTMPDCSYPYLLASTNFASGHIETGLVQHPGIPVEYIAAIIISIRHLFAGSGPVYQDVLMHPESYLYTTSVVLMLVLGLVIYFTGTYIYKNTKNIGLALIFQLTPLSTAGMLENVFYLRPECPMILAGIFFMAYLYIQFIHKEQDNNSQSPYKTAFVCAIFIGFLVASKFSTAPMVILPLFLLKGLRQKLWFLFVTVISFLIFIIPALNQFNFIYQWLKKVLTHDGLYGTGKEEIVNASLYKQNLHDLFTIDIVFTSLYIFLTGAFILTLINILRKKNTINMYSRAVMGIWTFATLLIFMIAKQLKFYYVFPAGITLTFGLIVADKTFSVSLPSISAFQKKTILYSLAVLLLIFGARNCIKEIMPGFFTNSTLDATRKFIETKKNMPVIITNEYEAAYIEPSIYLGIAYTGKLSPFYFQFEKKCYPNSYMYRTGQKKLLFWGSELITPEIFRNCDSLLVYFKGSDSQTEESIMVELTTYNGIPLGAFKKIYTDTTSDESIYKIIDNRALSSELFNVKSVVHCDLEKLTADKSGFLSTDGEHVFAKADELTIAEHHSGTNSILLNTQKQYGLDYEFNAIPGSYIKINAWRKSDDNSGYIVLQSPDYDYFAEASGNVINTDNNGWQEIELTCKVPNSYKYKTLHFYLTYPGKKRAYFDDVTITSYPMALLNSTNITCNLEKMTDDKLQFISDDGHYYFQKAGQVNTSEHHSGKNSIYLTSANPYGLDLNINIKPGDSISATVWRKAPDKKACIILSAKDSKEFYTGDNAIINTDTEGWEQIQLNAKIPVGYNEESVHFYVYNYGTDNAYFDDVSISVYH